jgi:class 3 adenylate cyclase/predicted ATPase
MQVPGPGTLMDIGNWLRSLGLERYEAAFRENEITEKVLPNLTAEDLNDIGVTIVGHRRTLLDAIAALRGESNAKASPAAAPVGADGPGATRDVAERRQVTVMFSDLVGSTALSARMDPEDLREVISAYQKCVGETVQRFGGFVAKYMGDGVLIYFGYPQAHEDDAERAVRAGLELVAAVGGLKTHAPLQTRVGIATGLVVVGDLIGSGSSQEQAIVGETPNLAARLQTIAEPNSVVIAESTRRLIGNLFELEDFGLKELRGASGPLRAFAALRPASVESRFDALRAGGMTALVGREEEAELLMRRWAKAKSGEGQVVLLSGEAGIGKSRLTATLLENLATEPHTRMRYFCSPQHTDSAFYPIIGQLERAAGFARNETPPSKLDKLDALLALASASKQDGALIAELLSLPDDGRYPALELTPQQRRQKTIDALTAQMEGLSRAKPLLMIFEDTHWADPTSLETFGTTVERLRKLRVLLLVTFRPEFQAPWAGRPHVTSLMLNRLTEREAGALIDHIVGNKPLAASLRRDIIERTDGIPLFVEEMTKAVLEAGSEAAAAQAISMAPSPVAAVPATLHASLMARLDRLGRAKEVAQIGAAIGREFSHALLTAVVQAETSSAIDRLVEAGLLFRQGVPPDATYLFKHALVQDAAYSTLLREPRRALHARIAHVLEREFPDIAENQPEILARHCTEAGLTEKAAGLWAKAGQRSLNRSALVEAAEQLTRALDQIATLPMTSMLRREQIKLQVGLMNALMHIKGMTAPETKAAAERARLLIENAEALGEPPDDPLLLFSVLYEAWAVSFVDFNGDLLCELSAQFLALAEKQGGTVPLMVGHRLVGVALSYTGKPAQGLPHYDRALQLYDPAAHRSLATRFTADIRAVILFFRSLNLWLLGYPEAAIKDANRALAEAREIGQAATLMVVLHNINMIFSLCGNYITAGEQANELFILADEKKAAFWGVVGKLDQDHLLALMPNPSADAVQAFISSIRKLSSAGASHFLTLYLSNLARACAGLGQFKDAWGYIGEAISLTDSSKQKWCEAEVYRFAGEIALQSPERDTSKAEDYFERALAVGRQQQAKSWELRASMSLARLWRDQGKVREARELLAPVYGWFTEGFDTRDLKEAKVLLEELGS